MCGPCSDGTYWSDLESNRKKHKPVESDDPGLQAERIRHLTHDETGNKYPDAE